MSMKAYTGFSTKVTPQSEVIPGREADMAKNNAGGVTFTLDKWMRFDRFLIIGTSGGTYYVTEKELTTRNAKVVMECLNEDPQRVVDRIVEISEGGRAPNNDPALFALAMASGHDGTLVDGEVLSRVARTGTHLFHFCEFVQQFRGWGRTLRQAIAYWYNSKSAADLVYQVVKYQSRDGWTHEDILRLAHVNPKDDVHDAIFSWVCRKADTERWDLKFAKLSQEDRVKLERIIGFENIHNVAAKDESQAVELVKTFRLTREMVPTQFLKSAKMWDALLEKMPMWAMLRNLGNMAKSGLMVPGNWDVIATVTARLTDPERVLKSRLHPLAILIGMKTYAQGHSMRGSGTWPVVSQVVDALNDAFYLAFGNVEPTGQSMMLALDVSGSMTQKFGGYPVMCSEAAAAIALVTANVEPKYIFTAFSSAGEKALRLGGRGRWAAKDMSVLNISPRERLDDVASRMTHMTFGGTDCALPMLYALQTGLQVDNFIVYTDSETWAGDIQPVQALQEYRDKMGRYAKLVVVGMTSNGFTIADPSDPGMLDVVGFSTSTPHVITEFIKGM